jgi:hypothetical protein
MYLENFRERFDLKRIGKMKDHSHMSSTGDTKICYLVLSRSLDSVM